jgi:hypothetical protein
MAQGHTSETNSAEERIRNDTAHAPNLIRVKQQWSISAREGA